ncbi:MAG TPA: T9SS type A sorting domain-containing protein, partial [Saprospiraceae bacterium]|nr:T9SS type A sorting domain-containing protein [Saprospiraceae bacterium]
TPITNSNPSDITLPRLKIIMDDIITDPSFSDKVVFVTPEQFTALLSQSIKTTSIKNHDIELKPFVYSNGIDRINVIFNNNPSAQKIVKLYEITGQEIVKQITSEGETTIYLPMKSKKYLLRIVTNQKTFTQLILH